MKNWIMTLVIGLMSASSQAQEVGLLFGFHNTNADATAAGASAESKVGFRLGVPIAFELVDQMKFKTGFIYTQRHFDIKSGANESTAKFEYIDVPALAQYNINDMFGVFGGLTMALNIKKDIEGGVTPGKASGTNGIVPLVTVGVSTLFNDMIGFDFYYEHGIGEISDDAEKFSVFGASFVYFLY